MAMEGSDLVESARHPLLGPATSPRTNHRSSLFKMVMQELLGKIIGMTGIA